MRRSQPPGKVNGVRQYNDNVVGYPHHLTESKPPVIQVLKDMAGKGTPELLTSKWQLFRLNIELHEVRHAVRGAVNITQNVRRLSYYLGLVCPVWSSTHVDYPLPIAQGPRHDKGCLLSNCDMEEVTERIRSYQANGSTQYSC
ncbi:hypothetical protein LCGC14_0765200 [marine sediment metagenome]|uniref:Uncharacterized protein n=1 Tax=marine sediment metagenome TaxID=412755 RepID=A0A0F9QJV7_9ZZZZ